METNPNAQLPFVCRHYVPTRWGNQLNGNDNACNFLTELDVVPTRWGNQLNGNLFGLYQNAIATFDPHSLGKSVEWKRIKGRVHKKTDC